MARTIIDDGPDRGRETPPIPHSRPLIGKDDLRAVEAVLRTGHLAQGEKVAEFEASMSSRLSQRAGVAVSSGTAALHLALLGVGVRPGDAVAMPSYACAALLHAAEHAGAKPVFVDIADRDYNLDPEDLRRRGAALTSRLGAVVVPHTFGRVCDLSAVREAAGDGVPIVEDCAHALGDPGIGRGDLLVCSFYATKMMTTGEGGMVLGNNEALVEDIRDLRQYDGKLRHRIRFNYKMTDVAAALGLSQLRKLSGFVARRRDLSRRYGREERTCFRFVVSVADPTATVQEFEAQGIHARRPVFMPLHRYIGVPDEDFPVTTRATDTYMSIPLYPALTEPEVERILAAKERTLP